MNEAIGRLTRICPVMGIFFYLLVVFGAMPRAEALELVGFDLSNQLEYSQNTEDDEETLENWLDVNYRLDLLTTGLRYEAFQPSKSGQRKEEVSFLYFEAKKNDIALRGGDFYAMFGRGMVLRSYEDRDLRVDNKLTGVKIEGYYRGLEATLLAGRPPQRDRDRADEVRGVDMNLQPAQGLSFGWSYVTLEAPSVIGKGTEISSLRIDAYPGPLSFYGELAKRTGHLGYGLYLSSSLALSGFAITAEMKDYDGMSLSTSDGLLEYNTPPALTREHTYALFRRHPHELDAEDEMGFQVESSLSPLEWTSVLLNYSYTAEHEKGSMQPTDHELFGEYGRPLFREAHVEVTQEIGEQASLIAAGGKSLAPGITNVTGVVDLSLYLDLLNSLRIELQGQHTEEYGEYDDHQLTVEYTRAPRFSLSLVGERTNKSDLQKVPGEANNWLSVQIDLQLTDNHDATLFIGSRQAGFICTGGRCRWEPEFEGVEFKLFSHF